MKWTVGVLLEVETEDAALDLTAPDITTPTGIRRARRALLDHLPHLVRRVVALIPDDPTRGPIPIEAPATERPAGRAPHRRRTKP